MQDHSFVTSLGSPIFPSLPRSPPHNGGAPQPSGVGGCWKAYATVWIRDIQYLWDQFVISRWEQCKMYIPATLHSASCSSKTDRFSDSLKAASGTRCGKPSFCREMVQRVLLKPIHRPKNKRGHSFHLGPKIPK